MPGMGMCPPTRYTASMASVNRMRLRRSGMQKMLANFSNIRTAFSFYSYLFSLDLRHAPEYGFRWRGLSDPNTLCQDLKLAARFGDLLLRGLGKFMRLNDDGGFEFAIAKNFDPALGADDAGL